MCKQKNDIGLIFFSSRVTIRTMKPKEPQAVGQQPDRERAEKDYRAGKLSIREIARRQGVTDKTIRNWAAASGWTRDLSARVDEEVRTQLLRASLRTSEKSDCGTEISDDEVIEASAKEITGVITGQRSTLDRARRIVLSLLEELEAIIGSNEDLDKLRDLMASDDENKALVTVFRKVCSLPMRVDLARKLMDSMRILLAAESEVWGIIAGRSALSPATDPNQPADIDNPYAGRLPDHILALITTMPRADSEGVVDAKRLAGDRNGFLPVPGM
jgi:transposase-like protein